MQKSMKFKPSIKDLAVDALKIEREYSLDWWSHSSIFRYNALMVSSFYGMKWGNFRQFYNIPKNDFLFLADSGGYQVSTQKVAIEPTEVLNWMEANVDVGMTLDVPPLDMSLKVVGTFENFKLAARHSKRNYEIMHRNRQSEDLKLLKVVHGYSLKELHQFHEAVKDIEFDGHAFGANQNDVRSVGLVLGFAQTYLHLTYWQIG